MRKVHVQAGLNDFDYCVSLHIEQATLDPEIVTQTLQLEPCRVHRAGDPRQTPKGRVLTGSYKAGYWSSELDANDDEDLHEFLTRLVVKLVPAKDLLRRIIDGGGRIECFVGLFANGCCDNLFPSKLLSGLGELGVDLRLDFYGSDDSRAIHSQRDSPT